MSSSMWNGVSTATTNSQAFPESSLQSWKLSLQSDEQLPYKNAGLRAKSSTTSDIVVTPIWLIVALPFQDCQRHASKIIDSALLLLCTNQYLLWFCFQPTAKATLDVFCKNEAWTSLELTLAYKYVLRDGLQKGPRRPTTSFKRQAPKIYHVVLSVCSSFFQSPHLGTNPVADHGGNSGGGEQALLSNPDVRDPIGGGDANNDLQCCQSSKKWCLI